MACGTNSINIGGPVTSVIVAGGNGFVTSSTRGPLDRVEIYNVQTGTWQEGIEVEVGTSIFTN